MKKHMKIAQISDCHLFANTNELHCGANVYNNLYHVLERIQRIEQPDCIVFTGDLTQDHSKESYQQFVNVFISLSITTPVHYLAGNHDEDALLNTFLTNQPFTSSNIIENDTWQIMLIDSKSETPAGVITEQAFNWLDEKIDETKKQLIMMHHHPIDVGYFIDKHGLKNKDKLWEYAKDNASISAFACGHVHQALSILPYQSNYTIPLYTCPATSIQFDITVETSACNGQGAGYRLFELYDDGILKTYTHFMKDEKEDVLVG